MEDKIEMIIDILEDIERDDRVYFAVNMMTGKDLRNQLKPYAHKIKDIFHNPKDGK